MGNFCLLILLVIDVLLVFFFYKEMIVCYFGVSEEFVDFKIV